MRHTPLTRNNEFSRVYARGKAYVHLHMVLYVCKNRARRTRVGLTATKKVGNAVTRNRARRVIRAAYLSCREEISFPKGYDLVFVAREQTPLIKATQLEPVMKKQILFLLAQKGPGKKQKKGRN